MKIKNGNARQEQIRKWEKEHPKSNTTVAQGKRSSVSFQED
jgi:hypothetical protein